MGFMRAWCSSGLVSWQIQHSTSSYQCSEGRSLILYSMAESSSPWAQCRHRICFSSDCCSSSLDVHHSLTSFCRDRREAGGFSSDSLTSQGTSVSSLLSSCVSFGWATTRCCVETAMSIDFKSATTWSWRTSTLSLTCRHSAASHVDSVAMVARSTWMLPSSSAKKGIMVERKSERKKERKNVAFYALCSILIARSLKHQPLWIVFQPLSLNTMHSLLLQIHTNSDQLNSSTCKWPDLTPAHDKAWVAAYKHHTTANLLSLSECASTVWCLTLFFFFCLRMTTTGTGDLCTR